MADEITFGYRTGATLTYGVFNPNGDEVTADDTSLPEDGDVTGYYHATNGDISTGDIVMVYEGGVVAGWGEYQPDVTSTIIIEDIGDIDDKIDDLINYQLNVLNVYPVTEVIPKIVIY